VCAGCPPLQKQQGGGESLSPLLIATEEGSRLTVSSNSERLLGCALAGGRLGAPSYDHPELRSGPMLSYQRVGRPETSFGSGHVMKKN
jgi:hypothetical protein